MLPHFGCSRRRYDARDIEDPVPACCNRSRHRLVVGGRPDMAQAGGPDGAQGQAALDAIEAALKAMD